MLTHGYVDELEKQAAVDNYLIRSLEKIDQNTWRTCIYSKSVNPCLQMDGSIYQVGTRGKYTLAFEGQTAHTPIYMILGQKSH